jgi:hypothetical protein
MKFLACLTFLLLINIFDSEMKVNAVRNLYFEAAEKKEAAVKLSKVLSYVNDKSAPILICYKGAAQMLEAKYINNPFNKLSRFKQGRELIENAIKKDHNNLEMRFIRFSLQTNLPSFLGYNNWIEKDKKELLMQTSKIKDIDLKQKIIKYLSKYCTKEEFKKLNS